LSSNASGVKYRAKYPEYDILVDNNSCSELKISGLVLGMPAQSHTSNTENMCGIFCCWNQSNSVYSRLLENHLSNIKIYVIIHIWVFPPQNDKWKSVQNRCLQICCVFCSNSSVLPFNLPTRSKKFLQAIFSVLRLATNNYELNDKFFFLYLWIILIFIHNLKIRLKFVKCNIRLSPRCHIEFSKVKVFHLKILGICLI
jgi:hypothetical protein